MSFSPKETYHKMPKVISYGRNQAQYMGDRQNNRFKAFQFTFASYKLSLAQVANSTREFRLTQAQVDPGNYCVANKQTYCLISLRCCMLAVTTPCHLNINSCVMTSTAQPAFVTGRHYVSSIVEINGGEAESSLSRLYRSTCIDDIAAGRSHGTARQ